MALIAQPSDPLLRVGEWLGGLTPRNPRTCFFLPAPVGRVMGGRRSLQGSHREPSAAMAPAGVSRPSGRAEERRVRGGPWHCKMPWLQDLACCGCLSGENEVNKASSAAPPPDGRPLDRVPQVARSEAQGRGQWGRLSSAYSSLAEHRNAGRRRVGALPGALPGLRPNLDSRRSLRERLRTIPTPSTPTTLLQWGRECPFLARAGECPNPGALL